MFTICDLSLSRFKTFNLYHCTIVIALGQAYSLREDVLNIRHGSE